MLVHVQLFPTPWTAAHQVPLSFTISQSFLKFMSFESVILSNPLILCCPLLLLTLIFPSIRVFSNESALHIRWPKYWSLSFSISPSNEYSELISFRIDWFDFLAVQGTLKTLLAHGCHQCDCLLHQAHKSLSFQEGTAPHLQLLPERDRLTPDMYFYYLKLN